MGTKKTLIPPRKSLAGTPAAAEDWVASRSSPEPEPAPTLEPVVPMKRLTLDIPAHLHGEIKASCALRGTKMVDEIRDLLMDKYGNKFKRK